ncbi:spermatogenesis-associated protein 4 [Patella vulgata]|uniref:spermatogenesis-associated protein 4 n=1 Tax=Patella vulgata TaxID=6465 RepID=UPI00217F4E64|nr:spermatogenesis-associated protein 4 [Patella vulgata]
MSGLSRELVKWLQSLDLTWQIKTPKWDLTSGFLVAEIFSWYFPQDIQMHSYYDSTSLDPKMKNWTLLKNFFKRRRIDIPCEYIEGTIHCKEGASTLLIERIYEILTNRQVRKLQKDDLPKTEFTDDAYQVKLPLHARSTASKAIKNNLRITEIMADQNLILNAQKAQKIINDHVDHRREQREDYPDRFHMKPSPGQLCIRRPPPQNTATAISDYNEDNESPVAREQVNGDVDNIARESSVQFKEIDVNQVDKSAFYNLPIQGY